MDIHKVKDRRGRKRYVVSKYWPNGLGRFRKYAPNYRSAQALRTRVEIRYGRVLSRRRRSEDISFVPVERMRDRTST